MTNCKYTKKEKKLLETIERRQRQTRYWFFLFCLLGIWLFFTWLLFFASSLIFSKLSEVGVEQFILFCFTMIILFSYTVFLSYIHLKVEEKYNYI